MVAPATVGKSAKDRRGGRDRNLLTDDPPNQALETGLADSPGLRAHQRRPSPTRDRRGQAPAARAFKLSRGRSRSAFAPQCAAGAPGWRSGAAFAKASTAKQASAIRSTVDRSAVTTLNPRAPNTWLIKQRSAMVGVSP